MYIQNALLTTSVVGLCFLWNAADGQIRQYNPATGSTEAVEQSTGSNRPLGRAEGGLPSTPAPVINQPAVSLPPAVETGVVTPTREQQGITPLGKAVIFIDVDKVSPSFSRNIEELKELEGLDFQVYVPPASPETYAKILARGNEGLEDVSFRADTGGRRARQFKIKDYRKIVYIDPTDTRRYYDALGEFDKFLRHVKRVKRNAK